MNDSKIKEIDYRFAGAIFGSIAAALIIVSSSPIFWPLAGVIAVGSSVLTERGFQEFLLKDSSGFQSLFALNGKVLPEILIVVAIASTESVPESIGLLAVGILLYTDVLSMEMLYRSEKSHTKIFDHRIRLTVISVGLIFSFITEAIIVWTLLVLIGLTLYEAVRTNFKLAELS